MNSFIENSSRIIVHFGMHKTGSSSIQTSFFNNIGDDRFYCVNLGGADPSPLIAAAFMDNPAKHPVFRKKNTSKFDIMKIGEAVRSKLEHETKYALNNDKNPIISSEVISTLTEIEFDRFNKFLEKLSENIEYFGYIRSPKSYMESIFQQVTKSNINANFNLEKYYPNYRRRFGFYDELLRSHIVRFKKFEPRNFFNSCVVQDFCKEIGVDVDKVEVRNKNEGLSLLAVKLMYAYRRYGPGFGIGPHTMPENSALVQCVSQLSGPKLRLHSSLVAPIMAANRDNVAWMEERLGESLQEDLTKYDDEAIRSEADLLAFDPEALSWLAGQLGPDYVHRWRPDTSPEEVAGWMHTLRLKLADRHSQSGGGVGPDRSRTKGEDNMLLKELVQQVKRTAPTLADLPEAKAVSLVKEVFKLVNAEIGKLDEGAVSVRGLGQFRVRQIERTQEGATGTVKRILFHPLAARKE